MRRRLMLSKMGAVLAAPFLIGPRPARAVTSGPEPVDVELVLAVDVSRSVDPEEQEMQFKGYAAAFRDPRMIEAFAGGPLGSSPAPCSPGATGTSRSIWCPG